LNGHDREQDHARAFLVGSAVTEDIEAMLRDEPFMARIRAEANKPLGSGKLRDLHPRLKELEAE